MLRIMLVGRSQFSPDIETEPILIRINAWPRIHEFGIVDPPYDPLRSHNNLLDLRPSRTFGFGDLPISLMYIRKKIHAKRSTITNRKGVNQKACPQQ